MSVGSVISDWLELEKDTNILWDVLNTLITDSGGALKQNVMFSIHDLTRRKIISHLTDIYKTYNQYDLIELVLESD